MSNHLLHPANLGGSILLVTTNAGKYSELVNEITQTGYLISVTSEPRAESVDLAQLDPDLLLIEAPENNVALIRAIDSIQALIGDNQIPMILLAEGNTAIDRSLAFSTGIRDILTTPIAKEELMVKIAAVIRARQVSLTLETTAKQLVQASIMRDKLATMIIHDLRSALSSLVLALESADQPADLLDLPSETFELAGVQLKLAAELCEQLLFVGRLERNELQPAMYPGNLRNTITDAVSILTPQAVVRSVLIEIIAPDDSVTVDHQLLGRIILNLVGNAIKASNEHDTVKVTATISPTELVVTVADHGAGIPAQYHESIFDLYSQPGEYPGGQGAGIGLAFCRLAANAMGGRIDLVSSPHTGSVFSVRLPRL